MALLRYTLKYLHVSVMQWRRLVGSSALLDGKPPAMLTR